MHQSFLIAELIKQNKELASLKRGYLKIQSEEKKEKKNKRPGTVAHACNLAFWEAEEGGSPEVRSSRPAWPSW